MTKIRLSRRAAVAATAAAAATPVLKAAAQSFTQASILPDYNMGAVPQGGVVLEVPVQPLIGKYQPIPNQKFPYANWAPELYAQTLLAEFAAGDWQTALSISEPDDSPAGLQRDLDILLQGVPKRPYFRAEILAQFDNPLPYWADMLMTSPASAPATWRVIATAVAVGQLVAMHFKRKFNRARPVQVYPALMPIAPTPGHPSYPSSHALQAHLITACLAEFVPAAMLVPLQTLAERVSVNREIAGVHFPSDTQASVTLVPDLHRKLQQGKMYQQLIAEAHKEWS